MSPEAFADLLDRAYVQMRPWSAQAVADTLAAPHSLLLSQPDGALLARIVAGECEILALATEPMAQRRGVASSLLAELFGRAQVSGAETVFLEVAARNAPARAFYAGQGFAETGRRRNYYRLRDGSSDDALLLSRPVAQDHIAATPASRDTDAKSG